MTDEELDLDNATCICPRFAFGAPCDKQCIDEMKEALERSRNTPPSLPRGPHGERLHHG